MKKIGITALFFVIASVSLKAQLCLNSEIRPRGEIRNGYKSMFTEDDNTAYFVSQRTRLSLFYEHEKYELKITGQDTRVWGDENYYNSTSIKGDNASIDLFESWLMLKIGDYSQLKLGRQEWKYDDQRLLSNRNWGQTGMAYDGVLLKYDNNNFRADVGLSLNNDAENKIGNEYTPDKMKFLDFLYLNKKLGEKSVITFTGILSGYQKEEDNETIYVMATYGSYFKLNTKSFAIEGSLFHQSGTSKLGQKVNAYLFSVKGLHKLSDVFDLGSGVDIFSGNDAANSSKTDHSFDIMYGGRHRFLGDMDYFNDLTKSVADAGIIDIYAKTKVLFNTRNSLDFAYHQFSTQKNALDPNNLGSDLKRSLGVEFDFMYKYKAEIPAEFKIGMSFFNATESMEILQGINGNAAKLQYFSYIQLIFNPKLFALHN